MSMVLDASTALAWHFDDENSDMEVARRAFRDGICVPQHWFLEVASGLIRGERRERTSSEWTDAFCAKLTAMNAVVDATDPERIVSVLIPLARSYRLSVYDAAYLELAGRLGLPLATRDSSLAAAARGLGIELIEGSEG